MTRYLTEHSRLIALATSLCVASLAFRFIEGGVLSYAVGVIGAVPVAIAAWFYGGRVALGTMVVEALLNVGLVGLRPTPNDLLILDIVEGATLSLIAVAAGSAHSAKRRLATVLSTDSVTGLANRQAFIRRVEQLMVPANTRMTMAVLDLVDFREVNDTFGYDIGDEVLRAIAARVAKIAGPTGFATKGVTCRFAIVWPKQDQPDETIACELLATVSAALVVRGASLQLRAHVGVGRWNVTGGTHPGDLIRATTEAMERAEREGQEWRAAEVLVEPDGASRLETLNALGHGIANGELRLHYQPIVALPGRSLTRFEALVRWQHPTRGLLAPAEFIPLAEQSGLIVPLTRWVFGEVVRQSREWTTRGLSVHLSVNIGAKDLGVASALPQLVERLTRENDVDPATLAIEVTESDVMADPDRAIAILRSLRALGVRIELDDFGTGYSSLSYLRQLPLDGVKIDRSFMRTLLTDTSTAAIVRAAIELSHALGLDTVAEGVEDESAIARLTAIGCDAAQGYFIARPMPADQVPAWIAGLHELDASSEPALMPARVDGSRGTVLVVDDEHRVRLAAHRILIASGFRVIDAATASEALQMYAQHKDEIGLVLTDVFLSDWHGPDLAARLRQTTPGLRIVYMSGDARVHDTGSDPFLAKPFSKHQLIAEVAGAFAA